MSWGIDYSKGSLDDIAILGIFGMSKDDSTYSVLLYSHLFLSRLDFESRSTYQLNYE